MKQGKEDLVPLIIGALLPITENRPKITFCLNEQSITGFLDISADVTDTCLKVDTQFGALEEIMNRCLKTLYGCNAPTLPTHRKLLLIQPYIMAIPFPIWGREILHKLQISMELLLFLVGASVDLTSLPLKWKGTTHVWVEQWPLSREKVVAAEALIQEYLQLGHIEPLTCPWNTPIFIIKKP